MEQVRSKRLVDLAGSVDVVTNDSPVSTTCSSRRTAQLSAVPPLHPFAAGVPTGNPTPRALLLLRLRIVHRRVLQPLKVTASPAAGPMHEVIYSMTPPPIHAVQGETVIATRTVIVSASASAAVTTTPMVAPTDVKNAVTGAENPIVNAAGAVMPVAVRVEMRRSGTENATPKLPARVCARLPARVRKCGAETDVIVMTGRRTWACPLPAAAVLPSTRAVFARHPQRERHLHHHHLPHRLSPVTRTTHAAGVLVESEVVDPRTEIASASAEATADVKEIIIATVAAARDIASADGRIQKIVLAAMEMPEAREWEVSTNVPVVGPEVSSRKA